MRCKTCKEDKVKNPVIRGKHVRFVDENGKIWNGGDCQSCHRESNKLRMRKVRLPKQILSPSDV